MNFLTTGRMSLGRVALNIMTCFSRGVEMKICCTSPRMSTEQLSESGAKGQGRRTKLLEDLIALVNDKVLDLAKLQVAGLDQRKKTPRGADDNVLETRIEGSTKGAGGGQTGGVAASFFWSASMDVPP